MKSVFPVDEPPSKLAFTYTTLIVILFLAACQYKKEAHNANSVTTYKDAAVDSASDIIACSIPAKPVSKKKKIYLTFDDGPNKGTRTVLDIMKEEQIPATFFLVGQHAIGSAEQKELMDSLRNLHTIELCNHSFSHAHNKFDKFYTRPDSVRADFDKARAVLQLTCMTARTPGRNIWRIDSINGTDIKNSKAAADTLQKYGYKLVGWDMEWHFEPKTMQLTKSATELKMQIDSLFMRNKVKQENHLVILAHDQAYRSPSNIEELQKLVRSLKQDDNYELELIKNYPGLSSN
jgi:peptidoglycan-N-acetylglucosamine deacetylase